MWYVRPSAGIESSVSTSHDRSIRRLNASAPRTLLSAQLGQHRPFAYALMQRDYNEDDKRFIDGRLVRFQYDSFYLGAGSSGAVVATRRGMRPTNPTGGI